MPQARLQEFEKLIEPLLGRLYRAAHRLTRNRADAQDLVQETCVCAWERLSAIGDSVHVERWLLRTLYHRFVDGARRRRQAPVDPLNGTERPREPASTAPGPDVLAEQAELERRLDAAWLELDRDQRLLIALRAEGYGIAELEAITGVDRGALRARLHRARRSLARNLEKPEDSAHARDRVGSGS